MPDTLDKPADRREAHGRVEDALADVTALLRKNRLVEGLVHEQAAHSPGARAELAESLVTRQNRALLQRTLDRLHPADIAYVLGRLQDRWNEPPTGAGDCSAPASLPGPDRVRGRWPVPEARPRMTLKR